MVALGLGKYFLRMRSTPGHVWKFPLVIAVKKVSRGGLPAVA